MQRILVLDDEKNIRNSICAYLEDFGYETVACESAEEALENIGHTHIDLAIVDLRLPKMDGETFLIEAIKNLPGLPVIIYTGSIGYHVPPPLQRMHVTQQDVLFKPVKSLSVILKKIETKLRKE